MSKRTALRAALALLLLGAPAKADVRLVRGSPRADRQRDEA